MEPRKTPMKTEEDGYNYAHKEEGASLPATSEAGVSSAPPQELPQTKTLTTNAEENNDGALIPVSSVEFIRSKSDSDVLGKGGFGVVRRARFIGQDVAVKALTVDSKRLDPLKAIMLFVSEAEKMREIRHPRIVEFKGFVLELFAIVMEFLPGGTLFDYIKTNPKMPWCERYWCATDVAEGMRFLHSKSLANGREKVQVFHQDLKTLNVLLLRDEKGRLRAKISDFGLSVIRHHTAGVGQTTPTDRPSKSSNSSKKHSKDEAAASPKHNSARDEMTSFVQHVGGTRGYMAPELMRSANFTKACDVYAYGIILFELVCLASPNTDMRDMLAMLEVASAPQVVVQLAYRCIDKNSGSRPDFENVYDRLTRSEAQIVVFAAADAKPLKEIISSSKMNSVFSFWKSAEVEYANDNDYSANMMSSWIYTSVLKPFSKVEVLKRMPKRQKIIILTLVITVAIIIAIIIAVIVSSHLQSATSSITNSAQDIRASTSTSFVYSTTSAATSTSSAVSPSSSPYPTPTPPMITFSYSQVMCGNNENLNTCNSFTNLCYWNSTSSLCVFHNANVSSPVNITCPFIIPSDRVDCLVNDQSSCIIKGCCWDPTFSPSEFPSCFRSDVLQQINPSFSSSVNSVLPYIPVEARVSLPYFSQSLCWKANRGAVKYFIWSPLPGQGASSACHLNTYFPSTKGMGYTYSQNGSFISCDGSETNAAFIANVNVSSCLLAGKCWNAAGVTQNSYCYNSKSIVPSAQSFIPYTSFINSNGMLSRLGNFTIQYQSAGASSIWKLSNDGRNFVTPNPKLGTQPIQFQMDITTGSFNFSGSYGMLYAPAFQKHVYNDGFSDVSLTEWYLKTINGDVSTSGGYGFIFFANKDGTFQNFSTSTSFTSASPFSEFVDYGIPLIQGVTITSSILFPDPYGYAGSWSINPSLPLYLISASSTSSSTTGQGGVLQCLSANGSSSLLSPLILANCSSDALIQQQQLFSIRFVQGSAIKITNSSLSLCLDLLKDPTSNVTVAIQNTCQLSLQSQKWVLNFQDMSLRSNMNVSMCLTSPILNQSMQMQITLQPCIVNGDPTQQWVPSLTGEL